MQLTKVKCPDYQIGLKCPYSMNPSRIVVHNTYNDASAMAEISYMLGNSNEVSFHYADRVSLTSENGDDVRETGDVEDLLHSRIHIAHHHCAMMSHDTFLQQQEHA